VEALPHCRNHADSVDALRSCARCNESFCGDCLVEIGARSLCATCKTEELLDVRSGVAGNARLDFASIAPRFAAWLVDILPVVGAQYLLRRWLMSVGIYMTSLINPLGVSLSLAFVIYEALFLQWRGQTLGKMLLRVKVVNADGRDLSIGQAWWRAIARGILGYTFGLEYIPAFFTSERTCVHDLVARSRVVMVE
jgi:uncharacterized RDD family membrane protein YckC